MRLIDADAYSAEMKDRQEAAWKWRNEAIAEEDELKLARAEGAYTAFTEAKLTMDKHIINPWHRVGDELPNDGDWAIFTNGKVVSVERFKVDAYNHFFPASEWFGFEDAIAWMPLPEPPKEDA